MTNINVCQPHAWETQKQPLKLLHETLCKPVRSSVQDGGSLLLRLHSMGFNCSVYKKKKRKERKIVTKTSDIWNIFWKWLYWERTSCKIHATNIYHSDSILTLKTSADDPPALMPGRRGADHFPYNTGTGACSCSRRLALLLSCLTVHLSTLHHRLTVTWSASSICGLWASIHVWNEPVKNLYA